ncbi:MAG: hypothetical protein PWP24_346 [Clostridiales bacterium]|nr:hypothetical protein [Clostridiales bacterium]
MADILVLEDDADINRLIEKVLVQENHRVVKAFSGTEGVLQFSMEEMDLIITDLMLPGLSGEDFIAQIRKTSIVPIIALSAKSNLEDKIEVLSLGADDYITKPFEPKELIARVNAQLRRSGFQNAKEEKTKEVLQLKNLVLDLEALTASVEGKELNLTVKEFEIVRLMLENPKKVFSKEALYEAIWKEGYYGEDNTISVHISNIRKKIEAITKEEYITTVWGIGFKLKL